MLDWPTLVKAHALVPVWYWPVLWHYLARLEATAELARAEGRCGFGWELLKTGVIRVTHWPESDAERAARGALPRSFDYTPWTRLDPDLAPAWPLPAPYTAETPPIHRGCTLHAPPGVHPAARGPPPSINPLIPDLIRDLVKQNLHPNCLRPRIKSGVIGSKFR